MTTGDEPRKIVWLNDAIIAVVEPINEHYERELEVAGAGTMMRMNVVELMVPKARIKDES